MQNLKKNWRGLESDLRNLANFYQSIWKLLKLGLWWYSFIQIRRCMSLKFVEELPFMTMNARKLKRNWLAVSKLTWGIWRILTRALKSLKKLHFNELLFNKVYVWVKKVQRCYVWWHWRLMQNLKENFLVLSTITWGIWQIFTGWKIAISF